MDQFTAPKKHGIYIELGLKASLNYSETPYKPDPFMTRQNYKPDPFMTRQSIRLRGEFGLKGL